MPALAGREVSVLIWTTTPWTIPSNLAIAFHPEFDYAAYEVDGRAVIVAEALAPSVAAVAGRTFGEPVARMKGVVLEHIRFQHPLYARPSVGVLGDYVTLEAGTGAVHTAPGHGADDFETGVRYGLEIYAPVGPGRHFLDTVELFGGQRVFDANPRIEEALKERGRLWHREDFAHSYPALLALPQPGDLPGDLAVVHPDGRRAGHPAGGRPTGEPRTLRAAGLEAIDRDVKWIPAWGRDRLYNMLANRPDWCISRQRAWGVPIPAVDCAKCGEAILTAELVERAASVFDQYGADAWYERPIEEFLTPGLTCPACGGTEFERERDILDVWFDSGSSHEAVLPFRDELTWPADMYLEGSDQHRGWFQSSLLVGLGTRGRPPFREVLTHGFLIDVDGRKMSKSLGNTILPAGSDQGERRRNAPAVGRDERLPGRAAGRQADPAARGRGVPQDPEHLPLPAGEPLRLRSGARPGAAGGDAGGRSLRARALRRGRASRSSTPTTPTTSRPSSSASTS